MQGMIPWCDRWWKFHQKVYPMLAKLAKIYLSAQATSVPSERIFSAAKKFLSKERNRLNPTGRQLYLVSRKLDWYFHQVNMRMELQRAKTIDMPDDGSDNEKVEESK
jgi:hypothetical protein